MNWANNQLPCWLLVYKINRVCGEKQAVRAFDNIEFANYSEANDCYMKTYFYLSVTQMKNSSVNIILSTVASLATTTTIITTR